MPPPYGVMGVREPAVGAVGGLELYVGQAPGVVGAGEQTASSVQPWWAADTRRLTGPGRTSGAGPGGPGPRQAPCGRDRRTARWSGCRCGGRTSGAGALCIVGGLTASSTSDVTTTASSSVADTARPVCQGPPPATAALTLAVQQGTARRASLPGEPRGPEWVVVSPLRLGPAHVGHTCPGGSSDSSQSLFAFSQCSPHRTSRSDCVNALRRGPVGEAEVGAAEPSVCVLDAQLRKEGIPAGAQGSCEWIRATPSEGETWSTL